jgi:diguanylate cyclase (GGDEF)-like protein
MTPEAALACGFAAGVCAGGVPAAAVAVRCAAREHVRNAALEHARRREAEVVASARRLAEAACGGRDAVHREIVAAAAREVPQAEGVLLFAEREGVLSCVQTCGPRYAYFAGMRVARDDAGSLPAQALNVGHRVMLGQSGIRPLHPGDVNAVAVPLLVDEGRNCVLVVNGRRRFDREQVDRLAAMAERSVPAYQLACEREGDRRRAEFDALTGLLTPYELRRRLGRLVSRAQAAPGVRIALLFVDTDRFKDWNDAYGHAAGDALLRALAAVLRDSARFPDDLVARNGGDEFCVVFTDTDKAEAIERADLLRCRIGTLDLRPLRPAGSPVALRISASIGVAAYPLDAGDASGLLERADAAMYHSKRVGRNAVAYVDVDGTLAALREAAAASNESDRECRMPT